MSFSFFFFFGPLLSACFFILDERNATVAAESSQKVSQEGSAVLVVADTHLHWYKKAMNRNTITFWLRAVINRSSATEHDCRAVRVIVNEGFSIALSFNFKRKISLSIKICGLVPYVEVPPHNDCILPLQCLPTRPWIPFLPDVVTAQQVVYSTETYHFIPT